METKVTSISVHELVDYLLRSGDIDNRVFNTETMLLGSKLHSSYQSKQGNQYLSEYALSSVIETNYGNYLLHGRADGIIIGEEYPIIDEIKTTVDELNHFYETQINWHLGQAICYAYLYLLESKQKKARITLTYISQIDVENKMTKSFIFDFVYLENEVKKYLEQYYLDHEVLIYSHLKERDASIKNLLFPYGEFRRGQRELSKYCFGAIKNKEILFAEAPTGIGKTMSTLFSFCKSFNENKVNKIFYLTAKGSGKIAAENACKRLIENGLHARVITITAKEKVCFCSDKECNPDACPFARGYYSKLRTAIIEAIKLDCVFSATFIKEYCYELGLCPFEFQLDLSLACDIIIADYNYFLDPITYLERYFSDEVDSSKHAVLIDEAHNLVDRVKSMYSVSFDLEQIKEAKEDIKGSKSLKLAVGKLIKLLESMNIEEEFKVFPNIDQRIIEQISKIKKASQKENKDQKIVTGEKFKSLSRDLNKFSVLYNEYFCDAYTFFCKKEKGNLKFNLFCLDPSEFAKQRFNKVRSVVLFSATMSPSEYYLEAIIGDKQRPFVSLSSPFPKSNFKLLIAPEISIKYKDRENTISLVVEYLKTFTSKKIGNYFIFLPSYEYLNKIRDKLEFEGANVYFQEKEMSYEDQQIFLENFEENPSETNIGVLILGGIFSEGIDLVNDRLIGVAVVGVGLPNISDETELIKKYYDEKDLVGFNYAYRDPGMNKVMQAVGRLIRTPTDRGVALLIDSRYSQYSYKNICRNIWKDFEFVYSKDELNEEIEQFYSKFK